MAEELINPPSMDDMTQEALEEWLTLIRARRSVVHKSLVRNSNRARTTPNEDLGVRLERMCHRLRKKMDKLDEMLVKIEEGMNDVLALRLQKGDVSYEQLRSEEV